MKKLKISLLSLGQTGAGPVYSLEMAKAIARRSDCTLQIIISRRITNLESWNKEFLNSDVDYHVIDSYEHTKSSVLINSCNFFKQENIVRTIKKFKAEVLYIPFGLMWARYIYWRLHKSLKIISTVHDVELHDSFRDLSIAELGSYLLNYGTDKYVDSFVLLNNKDRKLLEERTHKPTCVIPHASFDYYFTNSNGNDTSVKNCIGFFGRIEKYKGLDLLLDAYSKTNVPNLKLLIAGSGKIDEKLLKIIERNPNIKLINRYIKDEEFQELFKEVDFVVLPYKRASQSGVIPMCFAGGKTVVATNVGAISEQVPEGTGLLVNPNPDEIAIAIKNLYQDESRIISMGRNAKEYATKELTWGHSADLLINFCNSRIHRKQTKLLHVITSLRTGGAEKLMVDLLPRLACEEIKVELLVFDGIKTPFLEELESLGIKIHSFGIGRYVYNPIFIIELIPFLKNFDIVHTHNTACQLFVALANIFIRTRIITTEHNTTNRRRHNELFFPLDKLMYYMYDEIICISDQTEINLKRYLHWDNKKISTVYNGIDVEKFINAVPAEIPHKEGIFVITMVSAFRAQKDQDTLVRAMTLLPKDEYELWFVGGDDERLDTVKTLAKDSNVSDRVKFLGIRSDVPQILKAADVIVLSSHYEGLSLSSIEGMASGKPFIASDVDGLHEIVDGYGILFPHEDAKALANAIIRCKEDKAYAGMIGARCQERAKAFGISKMAEGYKRIYEK